MGRVTLYARISVSALDQLKRCEGRLGEDRWYVLDALIRSLSDDELVDRVDNQRTRDGLARAAWARGRR